MATDRTANQPQSNDPKNKDGEYKQAPEQIPNEGSGMPQEFQDEFENLSQKIKPQINGEFDHHVPEADDLERKTR